ncbi:MAG: OmpA family protein [Epsilonproteobacteria bacterium]|nr:OmpA family protein [Campylobacterota bacterium]
MKKLLLCSLLASSLLYGTDRAYEFGVNAGMTSIKNEDSIKLENPTFGLTIQKNRAGLKPRFDFEYVSIDNDKVTFNGQTKDEVSSLIKGSINGVYEFMPESNFFPYILAGLGYENVSDPRKEKGEEFESHPFMQGGAGIGYRMGNNKLVLRAEAKMFQIIGGDRDEENEIIAVLGLGIPFGAATEPKLQIIDSDGDGVMDELDKCPDTPQGVVVDGSGCPLPEPKVIKESIPTSFDDNECPVKIDGEDRDRDGVEDSLDQCPNTPCDFSVDAKGCPVKANLRIHFETDKARITSHSQALVEKFADFLVTNKGSLVHIVGHTDFRGSDTYNMILSKKRARSVRDALIDLGVSSSRLSTEGKGESEPMATNKTDEGMALNRRIEVKLTYPQEINQGGKK